MTSRDLPLGVKISAIVGGLLLLRFLTLEVLPESLTWPAYILYWLWAYVFWTGAGSFRTNSEVPPPPTKEAFEARVIEQVWSEHEKRGEKIGLVKVNEDGSTTAYLDNFPRPFGLAPRWVPYGEGREPVWDPLRGFQGDYLRSIEWKEQIDLEVIVRRSFATADMENDLAILKSVNADAFPSNPERVAAMVHAEIRFIKENRLVQVRESRKRFGHEFNTEEAMRSKYDEKQLNNLCAQLQAFLEDLLSSN